MKNLLLALIVLAGCARTQKTAPTDNLVLIQGVHLDSTVWGDVKERLSSHFKVSDLGRTGRDTDGPASLKNIADLSCQQIPENSILVGHSYGGVIINAMTGICAEKIRKIIYVAALVPSKGEKPFDLMNKTDKMNYSKVVTFGKFKIIPKEANTFFAGTDSMITEKAVLPMLYSEWMSLSSEAVEYDEAKFNAIPKAYIYTEKDTIVSLTTQFQYTSRNGIQNSDGVQTGHFPMISNPERLSTLITKWAKHQQ